jgi:hypothetical protein
VKAVLARAVSRCRGVAESRMRRGADGGGESNADRGTRLTDRTILVHCCRSFSPAWLLPRPVLESRTEVTVATEATEAVTQLPDTEERDLAADWPPVPEPPTPSRVERPAWAREASAPATPRARHRPPALQEFSRSSPEVGGRRSREPVLIGPS